MEGVWGRGRGGGGNRGNRGGGSKGVKRGRGKKEGRKRGDQPVLCFLTQSSDEQENGMFIILPVVR